MVYKKYIKKNGKIYGPYVYHSRRINGKVVSEYRGVEPKSPKKLLTILITSLILISIISFLFFFSPKLSGQTIFNVVGSFQEKNLSDGKLNLVLKEGELIPSNSKILIENNQNTYEYSLSNLLPNEKTLKGEFNLEEGNISGFGEGYGLIGTRVKYPIINFELELYNENKTSQKEENISINRTPNSNENSLPSNENKQKKNETQNINTNETLTKNTNNESNNKTKNEIKIKNKTKTNLLNIKIENQSNRQISSLKNSSEKNFQEKTSSETPSQKENSSEKKIKETNGITKVKSIKEKTKINNSNKNNKESKGTTKNIPATPQTKNPPPKKTEQSPLTGNVISNFFDSLSKVFIGLLTGKVTNEPKKISGEVSKEKKFEYDLRGKKVKIITGSVKSNGEKISENLLSLSEEGGKLIIKTNYTMKEKGFGKDYIGKDTKTFSIDLTKLNIILAEGNLKITLAYNNKKIILFDEKISNETIKNKENNNSIGEIENQLFNKTLNESLKISEPINFSMNLSKEEKNILRFRINESSIKTVVSKYKNKFLVDFYFGAYKTEHSYSRNLSNEELIRNIKRDKYLWMKDILKNLLDKKSPIERITNLSQNYSI